MIIINKKYDIIIAAGSMLTLSSWIVTLISFSWMVALLFLLFFMATFILLFFVEPTKR